MKFLDSGASHDDLSEQEQHVIATYLKFNTANKHKMVEIPVCQIPVNLLG